jgi:glutamate formiminotransferase/formiminotetrahydrofolate cyclodeaminase
MKKLIECVPNFSEGRDMNIISKIADALSSVEGAKVLNVDPGKATNRTVITLVGEPDAVVEAAFRGIRQAAELIDMSKHKGEHPRMGATDVCPFIPLSGISMEETAGYAVKLAERVGKELNIPVYLYEEAQSDKSRSNLSVIREGEYEGFFKKIQQPQWKPDFGPSVFTANAGATVIGARDFLVAYNVNLNTTSVRRANSIAFDVREAGRVKREGDPVTGKIVLDEQGKPVTIPGSLKSVKAIGWYIEEYGIAQISMNLTNIRVTPVHVAFDEVCKRAEARGMRVTGSELVGLIPLNAMLEAGRYFLKKQKRSTGVSESELIKIAVKSLGLDELSPFKPEERIIEYQLRNLSDEKLVSMNLKAFADETASESPAPGGGSVSAYVGALGVSLATMVANLSSHKRGWDERWEYFSEAAEQGQAIKNKLIHLVDEDTRSFNRIMEAMALPKSNEEEKQIRTRAIADATRYAIEVPLMVMETSMSSFAIIQQMVEHGNPNSITDAAVGALCARTAVIGAGLNVKVNASGYQDQSFVTEVLAKTEMMMQEAMKREAEILEMVNRKMS